jgi:hypothetical protein
VSNLIINLQFLKTGAILTLEKLHVLGAIKEMPSRRKRAKGLLMVVMQIIQCLPVSGSKKGRSMTLRLQWLMRCLLLIGSAKGESLMLRLLSSMRQWIRSVSSVIVGYMGGVMLLCERCDKGWHLCCLSPPLERVPPGNWYCSECMNSDRDGFGFVHRRKT